MVLITNKIKNNCMYLALNWSFFIARSAQQLQDFNENLNYINVEHHSADYVVVDVEFVLLVADYQLGVEDQVQAVDYHSKEEVKQLQSRGLNEEVQQANYHYCKQQHKQEGPHCREVSVRRKRVNSESDCDPRCQNCRLEHHHFIVEWAEVRNQVPFTERE